MWGKLALQLGISMKQYFHKISYFKVVIDKVDPFYLHSPKSRIVINEDTRLNMTSAEASEWIDVIKKEEGFEWKEAKFPTECWYLTLYAHHLAILPCIRRYQRRLRAIR